MEKVDKERIEEMNGKEANKERRERKEERRCRKD